MKKYISPVLSVALLIISLSVFANNANYSKPANTKKYIEDTIEFALRWNFKGDCGTDCYKFAGTGIIAKINGRPAGKNCHHVFIKCPSGLNLREEKIYKFIAVNFTPNSCSTAIDTCVKSNTYLLIKEIN